MLKCTQFMSSSALPVNDISPAAATLAVQHESSTLFPSLPPTSTQPLRAPSLPLTPLLRLLTTHQRSHHLKHQTPSQTTHCGTSGRRSRKSHIGGHRTSRQHHLDLWPAWSAGPPPPTTSPGQKLHYPIPTIAPGTSQHQVACSRQTCTTHSLQASQRLAGWLIVMESSKVLSVLVSAVTASQFQHRIPNARRQKLPNEPPQCQETEAAIHLIVVWTPSHLH